MEGKTAIQYVGNSPVYLDDFGSECERSCKGSLHLLPNKVRLISEDELKHIREKRPDISKLVKELPKPKQEIKEEAKAEEVESASTEEEPKEDEAEDTHEDSGVEDHTEDET